MNAGGDLEPQAHICRRCGADISATHGRGRRRVYCSTQCQSAASSARKRKRDNPNSMTVAERNERFAARRWREKIIADASARMAVITDPSKEVQQLGRFPLPIEVNPFAAELTRRQIELTVEMLGLTEATSAWRMATGESLLRTDGGHMILDLKCVAIPDADELAAALDVIPGVVEHGLFIGYAEIAGGLGVILPAATRIAPRLTPLAALGLATIMFLAMPFHVLKGEASVIWMHALFAAPAVFIAWGRWRKARTPSST